MRITRLHVENFRSIRSLDIALSHTTVLIGPNNAGKTAILEALQIALTRRWDQRGIGFTEYDIHLSSDEEDPKESPGVVIEIEAEEAQAGEWPEDVQQDLGQVSQVDPVSAKHSITLRVECAWNSTTGAFEPSWQFLNVERQPLFLNVERQPLSWRSARRRHLDRFRRYLPVFRLGALRDAADEFSSRSQFWGKLLRAIKIPAQLESRVQRVLGLVNRRLLKADPKLSRISETIADATKIAARNKDGDVDLNLVPLKSWDLLSRAGIAMRNDPESPMLPLQRHGQGVQSLSVVFLFRAFVDHLLAEFHSAESHPVLALEEPETHLHPQAARSLWKHVNELPGQKVITTHSPYFVQHVPFRDLRIVRLAKEGTEVRWLRPACSASKIPLVDGLAEVVDGSRGLLEYEDRQEVLTAKGRIDDSTYRKLQTCMSNHERRNEISDNLKTLRDESALCMTDAELQPLETWARRMRGEVFFAEKWMIVEGQADYLIVEALARGLGYDLDENGATLIDAQNNGSPAAFAALARALGIPWLAVFDGDRAGREFEASILNRGFDADEVQRRCRMHEAGNLEQQLIRDLGDELESVMKELGCDPSLERDELARSLHDDAQPRLAALLAERVRRDNSFVQYLPKAFNTAINDLRELT